LVESVVKDAAAHNYFTEQASQISASQAQNNIDYYNAMAQYSSNSIFGDAQVDFLFDKYLDIKYGVFNGIDYERNVSISPELEAAEKLGFLVFKDAYSTRIKGAWDSVVNDARDVVQKNPSGTLGNTTSGSSGGGGGGSTSSDSSGWSSQGSGYGGGGTTWIVWNPTPIRSGSVYVPPIDTQLDNSQGKEQQ
jgi:uncharacterized membrane protein YgcG